MDTWPLLPIAGDRKRSSAAIIRSGNEALLMTKTGDCGDSRRSSLASALQGINFKETRIEIFRLPADVL
jgi:hypothetical protein